jgi:glycerol-3-phosphate acyltransferase PlsY
METLSLLLAAAFGYLLGSIPFGLVLTKYVGGIEIRTIGSGNIGATNVLRTGRKDLALATLLLDSGKAGIALYAMRALFGDTAGFVAGAAVFLGHCFPVWLNFKGGKGVATFFGVLLTGMPLTGLACGALWILSAIVFRISSLSALVAAAAAPAFAYFINQPDERTIPMAFSGALAALIYWTHRANIQRLFAGTEPKIGQKAQPAQPPADAVSEPPAPEAAAK